MIEATDQHGERGRWRALEIVLILTGVYYALLQLLDLALPRLATHFPPPPGAQAIWWSALQKLVPMGCADLVAAIIPLSLYLALRRRSLVDLGFGRPGTVIAWVLALGVQGAIIWFQVRNPYGPLAQARHPLNPYALAGSGFAGFAAAFAEETFFRGYVTDELRRGGFAAPWQIIISMLLFGAIHLSFASLDWTVPVLTGLLGGFWSIVYILGRRSLWPTIAAHFVNDAVIVPSVFYMMAAHGIR
jgi:membrane protease YdiL (CAAX protease family)